MHEHIRPDRNKYVQYNCLNVLHYTEKLDKAKADGYTKEALCNVYDVALKYQFYGTEYCILNFGWLSNTRYDYDSIMEYTSFEFHDPDLVEQELKNPEFYPLASPKDGKWTARPFRSCIRGRGRAMLPRRKTWFKHPTQQHRPCRLCLVLELLSVDSRTSGYIRDNCASVASARSRRGG
jgi:hypothetical protein